VTAILQRTLGIDLASDPKKTGMCVILWRRGRAAVERLAVGAADDELLAIHEQVDVTGIDAPFGWPRRFIGLVNGDEELLARAWNPARRDALRFRVTDHRVRELTGLWPLSVSSDLIAVPAMRCVGLLHRMGVTDMACDDRVVETYPAAGLAAWGLRARGYKGSARRPQRERLVEALLRQAAWLDTGDHHELMVDSDDALDAVVAALIARAAAVGKTVAPNIEELDDARREGWIHVPKDGSLAQLV
jgi:predicted nuclease with RNAse H fold